MIIAIVGILSINVLPKFFNVLDFTSKNYFDEFLNSIKYAQKVSIATGCDVQVLTTGDSVSLLLRDGCRSGSFTIPVRDTISGGNFVKTAPSGVIINALDFPIYFDRLGRAHKSTGDVTDTNLTVAGRNIRIIGETGFSYEI